MSELEVREQSLMTPVGTVVDLSNPEEVAIAYDDLRRLKTMLAEAEAKLKEALVTHSAAVGKKSFDLPGVAKVEIKGGTETKWNEQGLKQALKEAGCPPERISEIIRETIEYKVMAVEARRAAKANPVYAEAIEQNSTIQEKAPSVVVTRIGGGRRGESPARRANTELTAARQASADEDPLGGSLPWE